MQVCSTPGCPTLTASGKCPACRNKGRRDSDSKRPSATERGYDTKWRRVRAKYLKRYPGCEEPGCSERATQVDHIDGLGPLGPAGYDWSNLRSYCHAHHSQRTARDQASGWNEGASYPATPRPLLVLVGPSGVGKSAVREHLAPMLDAVSLGPDDFTDGWDSLYPRLDQAPRSVVECCRIPTALANRITDWRGLVVELTAPPSTRRERLIARGEPRGVAAQRIGERYVIGYRPETSADYTLTADKASPESLSTAIARKARTGGAF